MQQENEEEKKPSSRARRGPVKGSLEFQGKKRQMVISRRLWEGY